MKLMIIRGSSGELNTDPGWAFLHSFRALGVETFLVEHDSIVRASRWTDFGKVLNQFSRAYRGSWTDQFSVTGRADRNVLLETRRIRPDVVLIMKGMNVSRALLAEVREIVPRVKIFNFYTDNIFLAPKALEAATQLDVLFLHDSYVLNKVKRIGLKKVERMWHACDPNEQRPLDDISESEKATFECDLSIVGSIYPYRAMMVESLRGKNLKVWGKAWGFSSKEDLANTFVYQSHQHASLAGRQKTLVYNLSKINLNTMQPVECVAGSNSRVHQVSASGGFILHEKTSDLADQYVIGEEVVTFESAAELAEIVDYFLDKPQERARISAKAYRRALSEHTYDHRAREILSYL